MYNCLHTMVWLPAIVIELAPIYLVGSMGRKNKS